MSTYVFVSGAWHGSWCWSEVVPLLKAAGHQVRTPDLRGLGVGETVSTEDPLTAWADQVADIVREEAGSVILVGHSRAGLIISEVAERVPDKIELLVYMCAFMLKDGQTLSEIARQAENAASLSEVLTFHDNGTVTLNKEGVGPFLYNMTPEPFVQIARARTVAEPAGALVTPVRVTEQRFGSVRRAYIECVHDRAIPLASQRTMQEGMRSTLIESLNCDHSPFFCMPVELVECLERLRQAS